MRYSEDILITDKLVGGFSELIGDRNPIHLDEEYAKKSLFGGRVAHGMLLASYFSKIIAHNYPGEGSIYLSQTIKFIKPCYVGDSVTYVISLLEKSESKFLLKTEIFNIRNEIILSGEALVLKK